MTNFEFDSIGPSSIILNIIFVNLRLLLSSRQMTTMPHHLLIYDYNAARLLQYLLGCHTGIESTFTPPL